MEAGEAHNLVSKDPVSSSLTPATRKKDMKRFVNIEVSEREEETPLNCYALS